MEEKNPSDESSSHDPKPEGSESEAKQPEEYSESSDTASSISVDFPSASGSSKPEDSSPPRNRFDESAHFQVIENISEAANLRPTNWRLLREIENTDSETGERLYRFSSQTGSSTDSSNLDEERELSEIYDETAGNGRRIKGMVDIPPLSVLRSLTPPFTMDTNSQGIPLVSKKEERINCNKYEENLKRFLDDMNKHRGTSNEKPKASNLKLQEIVPKALKSDGEITYVCFSNKKEFSSLHLKLPVGKTSKSAPPSLVSDLTSPHCTLTTQKQNLVSESRCSENSPQLKSSDVSGNLFKIPITTKIVKTPKSHSKYQHSEKYAEYSKHRCSEFSEASPKRPTNLNVTPKKSVYMFCPNSPGILRPCRSLPNINQAPKKEHKRSNTNFGKIKTSLCKALFSGNVQPKCKTPESLMSTICPSDVEKKFLTCSDSKSNLRSGINPDHDSNKTLSRENSLPKSEQLKVKSKTCKKLVSLFNASEVTNTNPTLQDSASSDISSTMASLRIEAAEYFMESPEKQSSSKSPLKRKDRSPVEITELTSPTKKVKLFESDWTGSKECSTFKETTELCETEDSNSDRPPSDITTKNDSPITYKGSGLDCHTPEQFEPVLESSFDKRKSSSPSTISQTDIEDAADDAVKQFKKEDK